MLLVLFSCILYAACAFTVPTEQATLNADTMSALQTSVQLHPASVPEQLKSAFKVIFFEETSHNQRNDPFYHYWIITRAKRHQHRAMEYRRTVLNFLRSAGVLEVSFVVSSLVAFIWIYGAFLDWPSPKTPHYIALLLWIAWGGACLGAVQVIHGSSESAGWMTGYLLELIFSIENVFVFHVVCKAFKAPAHLTQKALFAVVIGQVVFQAIFFMGLAHWLHQSLILPYILGAWLVYVGVEAGRNHHEENLDVRDSCAFKYCHAIMGKRLSPEFPEDGHVFFFKDGLCACTMLCPLIVSLCVIDVLFEVDVTLTKIETLDKDFMCFSSSVVAACAVPELYFVARNIFERYTLLRYGVSFVLVFYGVQMLMHNYFELPALAGIIFVMSVMGLCVSCSTLKASFVPKAESNRSPRFLGATGESTSMA